ncbi:MAG: hypothetical protein RLZZ511_4074 [Cyanobacteriota bacterium]
MELECTETLEEPIHTIAKGKKALRIMKQRKVPLPDFSSRL